MSSFFRFFYKFFIALALLFVVLVLLLKHGVEFENLHFSGANLDKFFIKLDENIILKIENLTIPKSQKQDKKEEKNLAQIQQSLVNQSKKIITLGKFFQEIDIKNINLGDQNITLFYKNDTFYIDNQELRVNTKITELDDGEVKFFLNDFELKNFNLYLGGELTTDTKHNKYKFDGVFSSHELDGKFELTFVKSNEKTNNWVIFVPSLNEPLGESRDTTLFTSPTSQVVPKSIRRLFEVKRRLSLLYSIHQTYCLVVVVESVLRSKAFFLIIRLLISSSLL